MAAVGILCVAALGVATNIATSAVPQAWQPYQWIAWPVLVCLIIAAVLLEVRRTDSGRADSTSAPSAHSRRVLLRRVHSHWIKGVLERSFYQQVRLELGIQTTVNSIHPWDVVTTTTHTRPRVVPSGTSALTVFDELERMMVVLGAPGSGKTTMLLELLRDALIIAEKDIDEPIPVMLNLTSWTQRRGPIDEWIVHEVSVRYQIPPRHVRAWLDVDLLLPVLDGLDEVGSSYRQPCIQAINEFHRRYTTTSIAVGCRHLDYEALDDKLELHGIAQIQPLSAHQVDDFLVHAGPAGESAKSILIKHPELNDFTSSPLMLSVLILAIQPGNRLTEQPVGVDEGDATRIFRAFVITMLKRRPSPSHAAKDVITSLCFLANNLRRISQTQFTIDLIDNAWLPRSTWKPGRRASLISLIIGFILLGAVGYTSSGFVGAIAGAITATSFALPALEKLGTWDFQYEIRKRDADPAWLSLKAIDWTFPPFGVLEGLSKHPKVIPVAAILGIVAGATFGTPKGWLSAVFCGATVFILASISAWLIYDYGFNFSKLPPREGRSEVPSPRVRAALQVSIMVAPLIGLVAGTLAWLVLTLLLDTDDGKLALLIGLSVTTYAFICLGCHAFFEQLSIRRTLHRAELFPFPAKPVLDYATRCLFLHKVGDGYIFAHQSLLDFFDALHTKGPAKYRTVESLFDEQPGR